MAEGIVRRSDPAEEAPVERASGARMQVLIGPNEGAPHFVTRKFTIEPGGQIPAHRHPEIEHEQFVLHGAMRLGIGDAVHEVKAGEAVYIPAGTVHWYENPHSEPVEFLCIVPRTASYETEWIE
ncbi:MAG TPA: cupin domain-containing protein [Limnochordia bacterium]